MLSTGKMNMKRNSKNIVVLKKGGSSYIFEKYRRKKTNSSPFLILTTIFTLVIAISQSVIAWQQLTLSRLSYNPFFVIKEELTPSEFNKKSIDENLQIINTGFPIINYDSDINVYIKATKTMHGRPGVVATLYFPVNYYFSGTKLSGGKDMLETRGGDENRTEFELLKNELRTKNMMHIFEGPGYQLELTKLVKIAYQNIEGIDHTQYFVDQKAVSLEQYNVIQKQIKDNEAQRLEDDDSLPLFLEQMYADLFIKILDQKG